MWSHGTELRLVRVQSMGSEHDAPAEAESILAPRSRAERFASFIAPHYDVLYRTAYRFTRSAPDAEDLVQEVCVRAYPELDRLVELDQPRAWLIHVMRRIFIDQTRRYERRHVESIEMSAGTALASEAPGPLENAERSLQAERLGRAWEHLNPEQKTLLALHDIEGYSLAELVELTGTKQGTLKSRLHRARVKLGRLLAREETGADAHNEAHYPLRQTS